MQELNTASLDVLMLVNSNSAVVCGLDAPCTLGLAYILESNPH